LSSCIRSKEKLFHSEFRCNSLNEESKLHLYILQLALTCCKQYQFTPDMVCARAKKQFQIFTPPLLLQLSVSHPLTFSSSHHHELPVPDVCWIRTTSQPEPQTPAISQGMLNLRPDTSWMRVTSRIGESTVWITDYGLQVRI
jgi:hypothetical protein